VVKKPKNPNFVGVWVLVPRAFLRHFDRVTEGMFPSRSEAIRRGMTLILDEVKNYREAGA